MAAVKFMTTLLPQYYSFLKAEAKRRKRTMREILEEALLLYRKEKRMERIRLDCLKMAGDQEYLKEMTDTAEMGMEYYLKDIDQAYEDDVQKV